VKVALQTISEWLEARVLACSDHLGIEVDSVLACDLMSDLLAHPKEGALLITGLSNIQVIHSLLAADMVAAVFARGKLPDDSVIALAEEHGIPLLATRTSLFEAAGQLYAKGLRGVPPEEHFVHVVRNSS
jgi:predicted transcriptional regulator